MLLCPTTRNQLLGFLPQGGEVAEIGVANGDFSAEILKATRPRRLHLIDPWVHQDRADYARDQNNASDNEQDRRYRSVRERFRTEIDAGVVRVHRAFAVSAASTFADGSLDWIYVDGMHTEDAVYADLSAYAPKVSNSGFIVGHDYANHVQAQRWGFGVVEAVNRFVRERGYEFVALTMDGFPTYVLARDPDVAAKLKETLILNVPYVVEIRDFPLTGEFRHSALKAGKGLIVYPSF